jgi:hypothetical protein
MEPDMTCDDAHQHTADYMTGRLPDDMRAALEEHLDTCQECAAQLASLPEMWTRLRELPEPLPDSAAMRARFRVMLAEHEHESPARRLRGGVRAWFWAPAVRPVWASAFSAAALVAGVGLGRYMSAPPPIGPGDVAALRAEVGDLRQMVSLSLLQQQSASERLKGVAWAADLGGAGTPVVSALLETLANDPNVNVRLASVDALRRFAERDAVRAGAVDALGRQTSPLVQMALIDFVVEARLAAAKDTLSRLAMDDSVHETVRARAERGLREVSS